MKAVRWITGTTCVALCVLLTIWGVIGTYLVNKDIGAWAYRAQVSSDAEDMQGYLQQALRGIEDWKLTEGHCALFFKDPSNNLDLMCLSLERMEERAAILAPLDKASAAYQDGLDDLRGTLREWGAPGFYCAVVTSQAWFLWGWILDGLLSTLWCIAFFADPQCW